MNMLVENITVEKRHFFMKEKKEKRRRRVRTGELQVEDAEEFATDGYEQHNDTGWSLKNQEFLGVTSEIQYLLQYSAPSAVRRLSRS